MRRFCQRFRALPHYSIKFIAIELVAFFGYFTLRRGRGLPGGNLLFFCFAKSKVSKRKGGPAVCDPSLRLGYLAVLGSAGVACKLASLRQARALIRLNLRSSAHTEGILGTGSPNLKPPKPLNPNPFPQPVPAGLEISAGDGLKNLDVRRRRSRQVSKFSVSCRYFKEPQSGPDCGSPFLWLLYFGEAKESDELPGSPRLGRKGPGSIEGAAAEEVGK